MRIVAAAMIISASRRTDLPALYAPWLAQRFAAGECLVANPFNPKQVSRISLRPDDVDAIVFWTRHARPLFGFLPTLDRGRYRYYFQYTITGYGKPVEPRAPPLPVALATFRALAQRLPPGAVVWRYDPILIGAAFPAREHIERFARIARALEGAARRVVIALVHVYHKTRARLGRLYRWDEELSAAPAEEPGVDALLARLAEIAGDHGMTLEACAQARDFAALGVGKTRCIDDRLLGELFGGRWPSKRDTGQREHCLCLPSRDIGAVDSCTFGCAYCYATRRDETARWRRRAHRPADNALTGNLEAPLEPQLRLL